MNVSELDLEDVKAELKSRGVKMHHKTGEAKLRGTLQAVLDDSYEKPVKEKKKPVEKPTAAPEKLTVEEEALKLVRVIVSPNDPLMATYPGLIFTVCSSVVNGGQAVKKYVPFNNEEGWHIPHIIFKQIENAQMQKFKQVKLANGESVLQPYQAKMYNIQVLPNLTQSELDKLAASQKARGDA